MAPGLFSEDIMTIINRLMLSPTLAPKVFYACIVTRYESNNTDWQAAYVHVPWRLNTSDRADSELSDTLGITYIGPGRQAWEYDSMVKGGTWIGTDWFERDQPDSEVTKRFLQTLVNFIHDFRTELGAPSE